MLNRAVQLGPEGTHRLDERGEHAMSRSEVVVGNTSQRVAGVVGQRREEVARDVGAMFGDAQHDLAAILRIRVAQEVARGDHPFDEVGDRRARHAHPLSELTSRQRFTGILGDSDMQQRAKVIGRQRVQAREGMADLGGLCGQSTRVSSDLRL